MEQSTSSNHRDELHGNSTTVVTDVVGNDPSLSQNDSHGLGGSFTVTCSSGEPLEREEDNANPHNQEMEKSLTLARCHLIRTPDREMRTPDGEMGLDDVKIEDEGVNFDITREVFNDPMNVEMENEKVSRENDIMIDERKQCIQNSEDLSSIEEEKPVVSSDDIVITERPTADDKKDKTESDTKKIIIPAIHGRRSGSNKFPNKVCEPVIELEEAFGDNEPVKRNNKVESDQRRVSAPSLGISACPVESGKERKHSTGEVFPNRSPLSLDNSVKGNRSGGMAGQTTPINHNENRLPSIINTDERTSNNKKRNRNSSKNVNVNKTRCQSSHGVRDGKTKLQHRNNVISRSYDKSVNILGSESSLESSKSYERHRPVSVFEQRYTMRELRRALPRKSFFSCHEKAMKDAGFETDDPEKKRKAERLKARLERIANEYSPLPSSRNQPDNNQPQGMANSVINITINDANENNIATDNFYDENKHEEIKTAISNLTLENGSDFTNIVTDAVLKNESLKLSVRTHKKRPGSARQEHIDCKPLLQYLEYVRDNKEEYIHHNNNVNASHVKSNPVSRLISMGKAFEFRHRGGIPRHQDDDVIVMAAKALRPRASDPAKYTKIDRDRSGTHRGQTRPASEDKRKQESHSKEEEHTKITELERKRVRAEEWTRSVSTNTLTKAKIQSLRELGADDSEVIKWWDAFKTCRYLRDAGPVEERVA